MFVCHSKADSYGLEKMLMIYIVVSLLNVRKQTVPLQLRVVPLRQVLKCRTRTLTSSRDHPEIVHGEMRVADKLNSNISTLKEVWFDFCQFT